MATKKPVATTTQEERKRTEEKNREISNRNTEDENIDVLTFKDIQILKRSLDNQADTIDDLVRERDEICDDNFALRKKLEESRQQIEKLEAKENEVREWEERTAGVRAIIEDTRTPIANKVLFCLSNSKYEQLSKSFTEEDICKAKTLLFTISGGPDTAIGGMKLRRGGRRERKQEKDIDDITNALRMLDSGGTAPLLVTTNEELLELDRQHTKLQAISMADDSALIKNDVKKSTNEHQSNHDAKEDRRSSRQAIEPSESPMQLQTNTSELLDTLTERIKEKLDKIVEEKLGNASSIHQINYTKNMKEAIQEDRKEQNHQERERKLRSSNVIIHGLQEGKRDRDVIKELFAAVNVAHSPKSITRLGTQKPTTARPVKLVMKTSKEKNDFMSALPKLKNGKDEFKRISITPDYTVEERREIAIWVTKAREKTANENEGFVWKARGTPKNMRLVKHRTRGIISAIRTSAL